MTLFLHLVTHVCHRGFRMMSEQICIDGVLVDLLFLCRELCWRVLSRFNCRDGRTCFLGFIFVIYLSDPSGLQWRPSLLFLNCPKEEVEYLERYMQRCFLMNVRKGQARIFFTSGFWFICTELKWVFLTKWWLHLQQILNFSWRMWWWGVGSLWTSICPHSHRTDLRRVFIVWDDLLIVSRPSMHLVSRLSNPVMLLSWLASIRECSHVAEQIYRNATWHIQLQLSLLLQANIFWVRVRTRWQLDRFTEFILQVSSILISLLLLTNLHRRYLVHLHSTYHTFIDKLSNVAIDILKLFSVDLW